MTGSQSGGPEKLTAHLDSLHTTALGVGRIRRNLSLGADTDVVAWCRARISAPGSEIERAGKNWYVTTADRCRITVNASSYTIITAHPLK